VAIYPILCRVHGLSLVTGSHRLNRYVNRLIGVYHWEQKNTTNRPRCQPTLRRSSNSHADVGSVRRPCAWPHLSCTLVLSGQGQGQTGTGHRTSAFAHRRANLSHNENCWCRSRRGVDREYGTAAVKRLTGRSGCQISWSFCLTAGLVL